MRDAFVAFAQDLSRESFLRVREQLVAGAAYDPYSQDLTDIGVALDAGQYDEARRIVAESLENLLLSPRFHLFVALLARREGADDVEKLEMYLASACVQGILATGDGTQVSPYLVTRTSDEYDVLDFLELQFARQQLVHAGQQHLDCVSTAQGRDLWFDVTGPYNHLASRLEPSEEGPDAGPR